MASTEVQAPDRSRSQALEELLERAKVAGVEAELVEYEGADREEADPGYVWLSLPNGRRTAKILVPSHRVELILAQNFESFRILGEYQALHNISEDIIEVVLVATGGGLSSARVPIWELPGAEVLDETSHQPSDPSEDPDFVPGPRRPNEWRLLVADGDRSLEISPPTDAFLSVWGVRNRITLKLRGFGTTSQDSALAALTKSGSALLFELDVLYGVTLTMNRRRGRARRQRQTAITIPPVFPKNEYSEDALALYEYGRNATGLPLLEFLAYYQSIEYFFPVFARDETVKAIRSALMNPRFNPTDDTAVNRLINLSAPAVKAGMGEREQLRSTVRACIGDEELRDFFESSQMYTDHFCTTKQAISGVSSIKLKGDQSDLRDQVADRIYKIRCRVVHAKQDGNGQGEELLLPSSPESDSLGADIDLLRLVAQRALFTRANRTS